MICPYTFSSALLLTVTISCQGSPPHLWLHHHKNFLTGLVPLISPPTNLSGISEQVTLMASQGLEGTTQTRLVFMALNSLVPNCCSNPVFHFCPALLPPLPTFMPLHTTSFHPKSPFFFLSGYRRGQVRHVSSRKTVLATPRECAALIQVTRLVVISVPLLL